LIEYKNDLSVVIVCDLIWNAVFDHVDFTSARFRRYFNHHTDNGGIYPEVAFALYHLVLSGM